MELVAASPKATVSSLPTMLEFKPTTTALITWPGWTVVVKAWPTHPLVTADRRSGTCKKSRLHLLLRFVPHSAHLPARHSGFLISQAAGAQMPQNQAFIPGAAQSAPCPARRVVVRKSCGSSALGGWQHGIDIFMADGPQPKSLAAPEVAVNIVAVNSTDPKDLERLPRKPPHRELD
ncbi:MAG: hypothetical protein H6656_10120 [Ardenticatenaceae bacterium]|nr:hypothetical protein [Ardenticatenaceae bacterium]